MPQLGELIEGARIRLALSQEALAGLLGVSQQTVSRWEQSRVQPRPGMVRRLAETLNLDPTELAAALDGTINAARVAADTAYQADDSTPRRPLTAMLPFHLLTPEEFERAITDLMERRFPGSKISQLGSQGSDQKGYDILVVHPDGHRIGVQCKRERQFGRKKVSQAVDVVGLEVDESFLALSRPATAEARFEMDRYPGWQLWDQADLSRLVRFLDDEAALQIVRIYFPGHTESFLGLKPVSPWRSAEEFYLISRNTLLHHRQPLVGRTSLVKDIIAWAISKPCESEMAVLVGRGGLGKSKLLWEVASRAENLGVTVRFLAVDQIPAVDDFDRLPRSGPLLVVLDDAQDIEHIAATISQVMLIRPGARVLLATRTSGKAELDAEIWRLNQKPRTLREWHLEDLTQIEAAELVAGLTSHPVHDPFTQQLAAISRDCPFIAVAAADLYKRGGLKARTFISDAALRADVFRRLAGQMVTGPASGAEVRERRSVLTALAVFQPVRLDDPDFERAVTSLAGVASWDLVNGHIRELEDAGLVLRRQRTAVRVIPDMFADVLVGDAAYDERSGRHTNLLSRAHQVASGAALVHLLVNASRIDWQTRNSIRERVSVVDDLWDDLRRQILSSSFDEQVSLLGLAERVAYYQPRQALKLAQDVIDTETDDPAPVNPAELRWEATRIDVINAVIPILRNVAYHQIHMRSALNLLWALAVNDSRPTNRYPDHPIRVLRDFADLRPGKSIEYIHTLIDSAEEWLRIPSPISPFEILEPILAAEGSYQVSTDKSITLGSFRIEPAFVRPLRQRVIDLAFTYAESSDIPSAVRAVQALGHAIDGPGGMYNREVPQDERELWSAEVLPVIERLGQLGSDPARDPAIRVALREILTSHAYWSDVIRQAAKAALTGLVVTIEDDLADCLHDGWDKLTREMGQGFQEAERAQQDEFRRVATAITHNRTDHDVLSTLEHRLRMERNTFGRTDGAMPFINYLLTNQLTTASLLCERVIGGDFPELASFAGYAVGALASAEDSQTIAFASSMLTAEDRVLQRAAASGLSWNRAGRASLLPGEVAVLDAMSIHSDDAVRAMAGTAASFIAQTDAATAYDLLTKIEFRESPVVAAEALRGFTRQGALNWSSTATALRNSLMDQILKLSSIGEYEILGALSELSAIEPLCVTRLLIRRIERQHRSQSPNYRALPSHWDPPLRIEQATQLRQCLTEVLDWMTHYGHDRLGRQLNDDAAELYVLVAGGWNDQAIYSLSELGDTPTEEALVSAARVIAHSPVRVLSEHVTTVAKLLRLAGSLGPDSLERTFRGLSATTGVIVSRIGDPTPEDLQDVEQLRQITKHLPRGSPEYRFYVQLTERTELQLSWASSDQDHLHRDGRAW